MPADLLPTHFKTETWPLTKAILCSDGNTPSCFCVFTNSEVPNNFVAFFFYPIQHFLGLSFVSW